MKGDGKTQIERLKERGFYGSAEDPFWNPEKGIHECCGAVRPYYHRSSCPACVGEIEERAIPIPRTQPKPRLSGMDAFYAERIVVPRENA